MSPRNKHDRSPMIHLSHFGFHIVQGDKSLEIKRILDLNYRLDRRFTQGMICVLQKLFVFSFISHVYKTVLCFYKNCLYFLFHAFYKKTVLCFFKKLFVLFSHAFYKNCLYILFHAFIKTFAFVFFFTRFTKTFRTLQKCFTKTGCTFYFTRFTKTVLCILFFVSYVL